MSGGTFTGAVVSTTWTGNVVVAVLFAASLAVHVTVVVPRANVLPEVGEHETETLPLTMSLADVENDTTAPAGDVASSVIEDGAVITGGVVDDGDEELALCRVVRAIGRAALHRVAGLVPNVCCPTAHARDRHAAVDEVVRGGDEALPGLPRQRSLPRSSRSAG